MARRDEVARRKPPMGVVGQTVAVAAGLVALAAGGIAAGLELEKRIIAKGLRARTDDDEPFFALRSGGPEVVTPDGVRLHVEVDDFVSPTGDDLTIVFVHGYALNLDCWHFQRKHFRTEARLVLYDQRSHGRSSRSAPELCRVPQLAKDLAQIMEEVVGQGPVVLIGHSMGGMTIMHLAQDHPEWFGERIVGVGLCSTSAGDLERHSIVRGIPGSVFATITPPLLAAINKVPEVVERGRKASSDLGWVFTRRLAFERDDVPNSYVEFMSELLGDVPMSVIADFYPAFAEVDEEPGLATLSKVECAVIAGADDDITPAAHSERIIEHLPGAEALIIDDCGHMGIIEYHEEVNEVLDGLVQRARRNASDDTSQGSRYSA